MGSFPTEDLRFAGLLTQRTIGIFSWFMGLTPEFHRRTVSVLRERYQQPGETVMLSDGRPPARSGGPPVAAPMGGQSWARCGAPWGTYSLRGIAVLALEMPEPMWRP